MANNHSNVPFTIVRRIDEKFGDKNEQQKWTVVSDKEDKLDINVSNINLEQAPHETLDMQFGIYRATTHTYNSCFECDYSWTSRPNRITLEHIRILDYISIKSYEQIYCYCYYLRLSFSNYLHEFNKNYNYEVMCKLEKTNEQETQCLFYCMEPRLDNVVSLIDRFFFLKDNLLGAPKTPNLCFYIRRLNNNSSAKVDDEKLYKVVNIFRNAGYDIVLNCKGDQLSAHRAILSHNSDVFQAMFSSEMKESQNGIVNMDFEARVVKKMLDYLYTGQLGEVEDMTQSLFELAHYYQLHDLRHLCEEYYIFNIKVDNDNIVEILKLAETYQLEKLKENTLNFANHHEKELIKLASYREYLIQSVNLENAVSRLLLAEKLHVEGVKIKIFDFIKENYQQMIKDPHFLELFETNGLLMKEIHTYMYK